MNYKESFKRFIRDPRTVFDFLYWGVRGIRVIALKDAYENDHGTLSALSTLSGILNSNNLKRQDRLEVVGKVATSSGTEELGMLFTKYGSDKATKHDYYLIYSFLLESKRNSQIKILEIGLGTNNTDTLSNMGKDGKPGASLRSFRDWAPQAEVYGADIDKRILFSEERIKTFYVDQTDPKTLKELAEKFPPHSFDLIIDDGLHNTQANINTLNFALGLIKTDGVFVVEDIVEKYIPTWEVVAKMLSKEYGCQLIKCKTEYVFIVNKKG